MYGLDLFSGIGGITLAISPWVRPIAYCEVDKYAQSVLLSRMAEEKLPIAPIWDDVRNLYGRNLPVQPEIIYGGFPCQDISVAGKQVGIEKGERSGLFFEIVRLVDEINPRFVFLENVPNIRTKGLDRVLLEFTKRGYDCRWTMLSAAEVGACHKRERWFFLAYDSKRMQGCDNNTSTPTREDDSIRQAKCFEGSRNGRNPNEARELPKDKILHSHTWSKRIQRIGKNETYQLEGFSWCKDIGGIEDLRNRSDLPKPLIRREDHGVFKRVDRVKCLGNAVVPLQAREAFKILAGYQ